MSFSLMTGCTGRLIGVRELSRLLRLKEDEYKYQKNLGQFSKEATVAIDCITEFILLSALIIEESLLNQ